MKFEELFNKFIKKIVVVFIKPYGLFAKAIAKYLTKFDLENRRSTNFHQNQV